MFMKSITALSAAVLLATGSAALAMAKHPKAGYAGAASAQHSNVRQGAVKAFSAEERAVFARASRPSTN